MSLCSSILSRAARRVCLALIVLATPLSLAAQDFEGALDGLDARSFADKEAAVTLLVETGDERVRTVIEAMLGGDLYRTKDEGRLVAARKEQREYRITDLVTGEDLGTVNKRALKKIKVNNKLRGVLRNVLASLDLTHPDQQRRLEAARELVKESSREAAGLLRKALAREDDQRVAAMMRLGIATIDVRAGDRETRLNAVETLSDSLEPQVRALLASILENGASGKPREPDAAVREAAATALEAVEGRAQRFKLLENLYFGLSLGSVLLLAAVGLAITFGVMGVINMAHGEMVMIGAYTTYVIQQAFPGAMEVSVLLAIPAAFVVAGAVGVVLERGVIRHLYGRPLETLLATFGVSLILQQAVRTIFSPLNRAVITPSWMSGSLEINPALSLTYNRLYIVIFSLIVLGGLALWLSRSSFGLQIRAVTQDRRMARAMGIHTERVDAVTFGVGSGIAGMAGVALSQLTNVGPNMGQAYIIDSFMVVVFGGVGNLLGTFFGAMTLGIANKVLEPISGAVLAKILVLVFIIAFIQRRPRGLFALSGRAADA